MVRTDLSDTDPLTLINVQDLYLFSQNILLFNNSANFAMLIKRFHKSQYIERNGKHIPARPQQENRAHLRKGKPKLQWESAPSNRLHY